MRIESYSRDNSPGRMKQIPIGPHVSNLNGHMKKDEKICEPDKIESNEHSNNVELERIGNLINKTM